MEKITQRQLNNSELLGLSYDGSKACVVKILTVNPRPSHSWHSKRKDDSRMDTRVHETKDDTGPGIQIFYESLCLAYVLYQELCLLSNLQRLEYSWNISPWAFYVNQSVDPLVLLLTSGSFRKGSKYFCQNSC